MFKSIPLSIPNPTTAGRFWEKVQKGPGCWNWIGHISAGGYGKFALNGEARQAHRVAYTLNKGEIPKGLLVCHSCDNKRCVNPSHLWLGTHSDNRRDAVKKGLIKSSTPVGEAHGNAKLTEKDVIAIRASTDIQRLVAKQFGVSQSLVSLIKLQKSWAHV